MIHRLLLGREALGGDFLVNSSVDHWATTNVHHPFTPTMRFQGSRACGVYGDFVHELDWIVGEVVMSLKPAHGANNTLVIFTSDNGGMFNLNMAVAVSDSPDGL